MSFSFENDDINDKKRIGDYLIEERIASGGMGTIYKATQISMKRPVALKVLHRHYTESPLYLERFLSEMRLLAKLEHPNIVRIIEAGCQDGIAFFAMEYVNGYDLKCGIVTQRRYPELEALKIVRDVAGALEYAWKTSKIVHRDVKPANIIVTNGQVKLLDMGISKQIEPGENPGEVDPDDGQRLMLGSPTYMSPEQVQCKPDIDFRSDIYSLGITLFHMLDGKPPYAAHNPVAAASMHIAAPVPDILDTRPYITLRTSKMLQRMMGKKPEERYESWGELIEIMEKTIDELQRAPKKTKRHHPLLLFLQRKTHRIVSLCILFVLVCAAFTSVLLRSLREYREGRNETEVQRLIHSADSATPELRGQVLEQMRRTASEQTDDRLKQALNEKIQELQTRTEEEAQALYLQKMQEELQYLRRRSALLESQKKFKDALFLWTEYVKTGKYASDDQMRLEIQNSTRYLEEEIRKAESPF